MMKLSAIVLVALLGTAARADSATHLHFGVVGQVSDTCAYDCGPGNAAGALLRAMWDTSARVRLGASLESLWYTRAGSVEQDTRELEVAFVVQLKLSPGAALDAGLGIGRYSGRVDIPETDGPYTCWGCGAYGGSSMSASLQLGATFNLPLTDRFSLEVSGRGIFRGGYGQADDVHNFTPPGTSFRADAGLAVTL